MTRIWRVFEYEFKRNIRRKGFIFATLGLPLIGFILLFGNHAYQTLRSGDDSSNPLSGLDFEAIEVAGYVDYSGVFDTVPGSLAGIVVGYAGEEAARADMQAGEIDVFYVIESDYLESGSVVLHLPHLQLTFLNAGPLEQLFYSTVAGEIDDQIIRRLRNPINASEFNLEEGANNGSTESSEGFEFAIVYVSTMLFFVGLILTNSYLMQSVIEERESRLIEILISTLRPTHLLAGKILALGSLGLLQITVWGLSIGLLVLVAGKLSTYGTLLATLSLSFRWDIVPIILVYFLLMYMTFSAVFGGIGALSNSAQEGSQYIGLLVLPTIIPFYAFPLIQAEPDNALAVGLSLFPITSAVSMQMRVIFGTVPWWQLGISLVFMGLTTVGAIWLAGRLFRVQTLLSGQSFKFGDLPGLLFRDEGVPRKAA